MENFNLSDEILPEGGNPWIKNGFIPVDDVKEFIQLVKELMYLPLHTKDVIEQIDKLAGTKLVGNEQ